MLQAYPTMPTPHDFGLRHKELDDSDDFSTPMPWKARGRALSDDVSTAVPSPEASPLFGPNAYTPLIGPDELLLPDFASFELPEAQDSDNEFLLAGFDGESSDLIGYDGKDSDLVSTRSSDEEENCELDEDIESDLLDLLSELAFLRKPIEKSQTTAQKIPYPPLESGFLPPNFMPTQSWLMPAGRAETGLLASIMAPRPDKDCMEPLNIVLSNGGVTLEVAAAPEYWGESEQRKASKAKAVFRRKKGRSRSPARDMDELEETVENDRPRGRTQFRRF